MVGSQVPLPIGQLLGRLLAAFRAELFSKVRDAGHPTVRPAHMHVFGNIDWTGTRLTELAARAGMTLPSMLELVDELDRWGYLERRADPSDGRAKLITLTREGRRAITTALRAVREIERAYAHAIGEDRFLSLRNNLQDLLLAQASLQLRASSGGITHAPEHHLVR